MADAQIFCTVKELIDDLRLNGDEPGLLARVKEASMHLRNEIGDFIPVTEAMTYEPGWSDRLRIHPLLALTSLTVDGTTLTASDYTLYPRQREWRNGPYTSIELESNSWGEEAVLTGRWGLYELDEVLGITATQSDSTGTSLAVTNGAKLSPGMVVKLGDEQELVTAGNGGEESPDPTLATSQLNGAIDSDDEDITVDNGTEFNAGEVIRLDTEDIYLVKRAGNVWASRRGWNGTTKASHLDNCAIYVYRTFTVQRGANGTTAAAHSNVAVSRCITPSDVNYLCRQVAALMRMKAMTGFSGRAGGGELGEAFFVNEFPRQIAAIKKNYRVW